MQTSPPAGGCSWDFAIASDKEVHGAPESFRYRLGIAAGGIIAFRHAQTEAKLMINC